MSEKIKSLILLAVIAIIITSVILVTFVFTDNTKEEAIGPAPDFSATDIDGNDISLGDYEGKILVVHFGYMTDGTCIHCVLLNQVQVDELTKVYQNTSRDEVEFLTIDMTYDQTNGQAEKAREQYNITWPVINDPFAGSNTDRRYNETLIGGRYIRYLLDQDGAIVNPGVVLINEEGEVVGTYHVGIIPSGFDYDADEMTDEDKENLLTAEELEEKIEILRNDAWGETVEGKVYAGLSFGGMFLLGITVSVTPCALALLLSIATYVASTNKKMRGGEEEEEEGPHIKMLGKNTESDMWYGLSAGLAFILGIGLVFFLMGTLFTFISIFIANAAIFYLVAGILMIIFGLHNIIGFGDVYRKYFKKEIEISFDDDWEPPKPGLIDRGREFGLRVVDRYAIFGAFFLGALLALGWAPCALSIVLPVMLILMTQGIPVLVGGLYLFIFALGFGVPVVALSILTATVKQKISDRLESIGKWIPRALGVLIIIVGIIMGIRFFGIKFW